MRRPGALLIGLVAAFLAVAGVPLPIAGASENTSTPSSVIPVDPTELGGAVSYPYATSVPSFPSSISGYRLSAPKKRSEQRLFQGAKWFAIPPMDQGLAGHCDVAIWLVRWRSRNPDVQVAAALGDTAFPGFNRLGKPATGGAGYITGNACVSPGLKFARAINGNGSNLVDVDYEYQIWFPKRKI